MRVLARAALVLVVAAACLMAPLANAQVPQVTCPGSRTLIQAGLWSLPNTTALQNRTDVWSGGPNRFA